MSNTDRVTVLDIETRSVLNLKRCGVTRYANHPSTRVLCLSWGALESDETPDAWWTGCGFPPPFDLFVHIERGGMIAAWNVAFDLAIWNACMAPLGWPRIALEQVHDIAAQAASASLPRGLEKCAEAIGLPVNKDREGRLAMRALMAPQKWVNGQPVWRPAEGARLDALVAYCRQDVVVERAAMRWLPAMQPAERPVFLQDLRINARGMRIDPQFLPVAGPFYERVLAEAHVESDRITGGAVPTITNTGKACLWLENLGVPLEGGKGAAAGDDEDEGDEPAGPPSRRGAMTKEAVRAYLARPDLPGVVREFLELRQATVRTSTAKLLTLAAATIPGTGRIHDTLTFHAASTGRAGGALLQPQNLPRDSYDETTWRWCLEAMDDVFKAGWPLARFAEVHGAPMVALVKMLRGAIAAAPGCELVGGDFAQIELRVTAWLAGETKLLDMLAGGTDAYRKMAAIIYNVDENDIDPVQRQVGKSATLGCGFGLGARKFIEFVLTNTGLVVGADIAERAVKAFRLEYRRIPMLWRDLEDAALEAVHSQGTVVECAGGRLAFWCAPGRSWLILRLPSGRVLRYRRPSIEIEDAGAGPREVLRFWGVNQMTRRWGIERTWGGPLVENAVQATARDLLMQAVLRIEARGWPVVLHIHDEALSEVPVGSVTEAEYAEEMARPLPWAAGLPVKVEPWHGVRYG